MFICNIKLNGNKLFKIGFVLIALLVTLILISAIYKIIFNNNVSSVNDGIPEETISKISVNNYTNILKCVHDDLDSYIGKQISFTGYVYRVYDLEDSQFVLARDMVISSDYQTLVVGFLCDYSNAKDFEDNTWVNITGTIEKGNYHGDIPVLKITSIERCEKPSDEYVYPPDDDYVPTSAIY